MTKLNHATREQELTASELDAVTGGDKAATGGATKTTSKTPYMVYTMQQVLVSG
jgi:hypothetical protein